MILETVRPFLQRLYQSPAPQFSSVFKVIGDTANSLSLQICSNSDAFTIEGDWICCTVFSYFPRNDLIHLLSAFLLEKQILIMSHNFALLTATM